MPEETEVGGTMLDKSIGFSGCSGNLGISGCCCFFFDFLEPPLTFVMLLAAAAAEEEAEAEFGPWRQLMDFFNDEGVVERL